MDTEFEAQLLRMIDEFLDSDPDFDAFVRFKDSYCGYYSERSEEVTRPISSKLPTHLPIHEWFRGEAGQEMERLYYGQLSEDRREFFDLVAERTWYTARGELDAQARDDGYGGLGDFLDLLRREREKYRHKFAR